MYGIVAALLRAWATFYNLVQPSWDLRRCSPSLLGYVLKILHNICCFMHTSYFLFYFIQLPIFIAQIVSNLEIIKLIFITSLKIYSFYIKMFTNADFFAILLRMVEDGLRNFSA